MTNGTAFASGCGGVHNERRPRPVDGDQRWKAWLRERLQLTPGDPDPGYLFPALNRNPRGTRHRPLGGYHKGLQRLAERLR